MKNNRRSSSQRDNMPLVTQMLLCRVPLRRLMSFMVLSDSGEEHMRR